MWRTIYVWILAFAIVPPYVTAYSGGSGTLKDPYQITNNEDLLQLAASTWDYNKSFILLTDIDLSDHIFQHAVIAADTDPFTHGFQGTEFSGSFDGNGFAIRNLTINPLHVKEDFLGLFGFLRSGSVVKNLGVENVVITSNGMAAGGLAGANYGTIVNCYATGSVATDALAGGLAGYCYKGSISASYADADINARWQAGGLVGYNAHGTIANCYAGGSVNASVSMAGGLVGYNLWGTIITCYSVGRVHGGDKVGGFVGYIVGDLVTGCVWNSETSGCSTGVAGIRKTTEQLLMRSTFYGEGWVPGLTSNALMFDGIDDYVKISNFSGVSGTQSRTCSAWIKPQPTATEAMIISWGENVPGRKWMLRVGSTGELTVGVGGGYIKGSTVLTDGQWHHVAAVLNNDGHPSVDKIILYVDGQPETNLYFSSTQSIDTSSTQATYIGAQYSSTGNRYGDFFDGMIRDVRVYNRALDASELLCADHMPTTGLLAWWTMDQDKGSVLKDFMSSFDGILNNFNGLGWDFVGETSNGINNIWRMCIDGVDYPRLSWESTRGDVACPDGVNVEDVFYYSSKWLMSDCTIDNNYCGGADMNYSGSVNLIDWAMLAENWLCGL